MASKKGSVTASSGTKTSMGSEIGSIFATDDGIVLQFDSSAAPAPRRRRKKSRAGHVLTRPTTFDLIKNLTGTLDAEERSSLQAWLAEMAQKTGKP
jgi:hypothetical protein